MTESATTPLPRKLGIKPGQRLVFVNAPANFANLVGPLPLGSDLSATGQQGEFDLIVFFARDRTEMGQHLAELARRLAPNGGLWVAWPKKASGVPTDLSDDIVRAAGLVLGLVDNKVCAIDATWSGQRFVYRLKDRPKS
jgi:hypothetical protein